MALASGLARAPVPAALSHRRLAPPATCGALHHISAHGATACRSRAAPWPSTGVPFAGVRLRNAVRAQAAAAADSGDGGSSGSSGKALPAPLSKLAALFRPLSDERCNAKLLALAVGQMLCSIATLIHDSYLPLYVHEELGLSTTKIGAVQGAAQFLCQLSKGVSGVVGDVLGSQTRVLVFGTLLTFACKPMFALLSTVYGVFGVTACLYWFFVAKLLDRLSKGIREAPTKAVMNELAKESGDAPDAAYGLRQSLATAGMLIGSTVAAVTFAATGSNYILTFAVAAVPPGLALAWLVTVCGDGGGGAELPRGAVRAAPHAAAAAARHVLHNRLHLHRPAARRIRAALRAELPGLGGGRRRRARHGRLHARRGAAQPDPGSRGGGGGAGGGGGRAQAELVAEGCGHRAQLPARLLAGAGGGGGSVLCALRRLLPVAAGQGGDAQEPAAHAHPGQHAGADPPDRPARAHQRRLRVQPQPPAAGGLRLHGGGGPAVRGARSRQRRGHVRGRRLHWPTHGHDARHHHLHDLLLHAHWRHPRRGQAVRHRRVLHRPTAGLRAGRQQCGGGHPGRHDAGGGVRQRRLLPGRRGGLRAVGAAAAGVRALGRPGQARAGGGAHAEGQGGVRG